MIAMGVDGCKAGWFFFRFDGVEVRFGVAARLEEVLACLPEDARVMMDIPIGLPERGPNERVCDVEARRLLAPARGSSVFSVPCRQAVHATDYQAALTANRAALGRGISRQSWGIVPKIREVDELLTRSEGVRRMVRECHPEVCFRGVAGHPMRASKRTRAGAMERLAVLERVMPGAEAHAASGFLRHGGFDAARDDVIDALIVTACALHPERNRTLPADPPRDAYGLPMEIVYLAG